MQACSVLPIDIVTVDLTNKLPFTLKYTQLTQVDNVMCIIHTHAYVHTHTHTHTHTHAHAHTHARTHLNLPKMRARNICSGTWRMTKAMARKAGQPTSR